MHPRLSLTRMPQLQLKRTISISPFSQTKSLNSIKLVRFSILSFALSISAFALNTIQASELTKPQATQMWQEAQNYFINGQAEACFESLLPLQQYSAGEVAYDRLLGLCATGAQQHEQALLAFERIMLQQPRNAEIRLERARAYYLTGQIDEADREFRYLAASKPPAAAARVIDLYLEKIKTARQPKLKLATRLELRAQVGYDTNANAASNLDQFLGFDVTEQSQSTESIMYGANASLSHSRPLSNKMLLSISTNLGSKNYPDADFVDQNLATVGIGLGHYHAQNVTRADVFTFAQTVDSSLNSKGGFYA